jgi:hypothetical protein
LADEFTGDIVDAAARIATAAPRAPTAAQPIEDRAHRLSRLSHHEESGSGGPGTISSGIGDPGRKSYGTYQLNQTTVGSFVTSDLAVAWSREFHGLRPGSGQFDAAWRRVAAREPEAFEDAQYAFLRRENYSRLVERVRRSTGLDVEALGATMRNVVWSTATHQAWNTQLRTFERAVTRADQRFRRDHPRYGEELIRQIYLERIDHSQRESAQRSNRGEARTARNLATGRLPREMNEALQMYRRERTR